MAGRKKGNPNEIKRHRTAPRLYSDDDLAGFDNIEMGIKYLNSIGHEAMDKALRSKKRSFKKE